MPIYIFPGAKRTIEIEENHKNKESKVLRRLSLTRVDTNIVDAVIRSFCFRCCIKKFENIVFVRFSICVSKKLKIIENLSIHFAKKFL